MKSHRLLHFWTICTDLEETFDGRRLSRVAKIYWASGEIPKTSTSLLCRKKGAEPSARRLSDCYAKQFFHPNAPTRHSGVFAFVILEEGRA